jgi:hypothetical protein
VAICGGSVSFKFKIGETVKRKAPDSAEHFKVVSLLLSGYVKVRSLDTHFPTIVKADDFEEVKISVDADA